MSLNDFARTHARADDPATSRAAAHSVEKPALALQERIYECLQRHGPQTQSIIAKRLGLEAQQVNKRVADLRHAGRIEDSGHTERGPSGRMQTLWQIVRGQMNLL